MNPLFATQYSSGDVAHMLAMMILPSALAVATFCFAFVAWRRRKEPGFLVLAVGLGMQAVTVIIPAVFVWRGESAYSAIGSFVWLFKIPVVICLIGWGLLAKKKPGAKA